MFRRAEYGPEEGPAALKTDRRNNCDILSDHFELPADRQHSFWSWFVLMIGVILGVDFMLGKNDIKTTERDQDTARRMAELDFTAHCTVHTRRTNLVSCHRA